MSELRPAEQPCRACERGDHGDCWGVDPPRGMPLIVCPCVHLSHAAASAEGDVEAMVARGDL